MNPAGPHPHPSPDDDAASPRRAAGSGAERRRAAVVAGHTGDVATARILTTDPDPTVRAAALGALVRAGGLDHDLRAAAAADNDPQVRRRLAEELGRHLSSGESTDEVVALLVDLLTDADPLTAEAAAWALGEVASGSADGHDLTAVHDPLTPVPPIPSGAVPALVEAARHDDPLVREAAVAALGAIGDPTGLDTVLTATTDRPAIRRRAVLALAAFLGEPGVDDALERALGDRDWQVRQAAELLRRPDP